MSDCDKTCPFKNGRIPIEIIDPDPKCILKKVPTELGVMLEIFSDAIFLEKAISNELKKPSPL